MGAGRPARSHCGDPDKGSKLTGPAKVRRGQVLGGL